jgi:ABC-type transporter Mla MlaB component
MADPAARTLTFALRGALAREELPALADGIGWRLERAQPTIALVDVAGLAADAVSLEALALIALHARRAGYRIHLHGCSSGLRAMIELAGLGELF